MTMTRLERLKERVIPEHMDAFNETVHIVERIDEIVFDHDLVIHHNAIAGDKPNGEVEAMFHEAMKLARNAVVDVLEKKVQDWEHKGDKYYNKHFNDKD